MILGIGSILFSDEGFGVRIVEALQRRYQFPDHVSVIDGGVLGVHLMGVMSEADELIVIDAVRNKGAAGDLYRIAGDDIPPRIRAKNSIHQIDFLEALTLCQALDKVPNTVIIGVEPEDIETLSTDLTPTLAKQVEPVIDMVLQELDRLGVSYQSKSEEPNVSGNPI